MPETQHSEFALFAMETARRSGAHLLTLLPDLMVEKEIAFKGLTDLVTRADREVEAMIVGAIRARYPDHALLAEEGTLIAGADFRWIVDPLDGTTNFAHGLPWFGVSIALEHHDQVLLGVVHHPPLGETFVAERGRGAWVLSPDGVMAPLAVSKTDALGSALLATGLPGPERRGRHLETIPRVIERAREVRIMGSAAVHLAYVAAGRLDGFWEPGLNLWDIAAGLLLVEEAGGRASGLDGGPARPRSTLVSNGLIHEAMLAVLRGGE